MPTQETEAAEEDQAKLLNNYGNRGKLFKDGDFIENTEASEKTMKRNYENLALRAIDLKKLDLKPEAPKKALAIQGGSEVTDVTGDLK